MTFKNISKFLTLLSALSLGACQTTTQEKTTSSSSSPISIQKLPPRTLQDSSLAPNQAANKLKVALLTPLSGTHAKLGQDMLSAAQLSLFAHGGNRVEMMIYDTKGNPDEATSVAHQALQDGAQLFIGPVFSSEVQAISAVTVQAGVPILSFSNSESVAGPTIFTLGFDPKDQIDAILQVAATHGMRHIGAMLPENAYGQLLQESLNNAARAHSVQVSPVVFYTPGAGDFSQQTAQFKDQPLQGILVPEGGQTLKLITSALLYNDVDMSEIKLLGTGQWDTPATFNDDSLLGGWYAATPPNKRVQFEQKFHQQFGHYPPRIATLAYDAISLAIVLSQQATTPSNMIAALTQPRGFDGMDGAFRLNANGHVDRPLAVLEVATHGVRVVSPAQSSF